VLFRAADDYAAAAQTTAAIEQKFGIVGAQVLRYDDTRRGNSRRILIGDGKLQAVALAGDISAEGWLKEYLESEQPVAALGRLLLMPSNQAPQNFKSRGRIVCNCFNVAETEIVDALTAQSALAPAARLAGLQQQLKCGTNCGSCIPELKKIIFDRRMPAQAA
jgi:assimilatory nitrate reductase catalytic subunit